MEVSFCCRPSGDRPTIPPGGVVVPTTSGLRAHDRGRSINLNQISTRNIKAVNPMFTILINKSYKYVEFINSLEKRSREWGLTSAIIN